MTREDWLELSRLARKAAVEKQTLDTQLFDAVGALAQWHGESGDLEGKGIGG